MKRKAGTGVIQRFLAFVDRHDLTGASVGIAFSGGPDSTALAICAAEAAGAKLLLPVLVHVDHGVRMDSGRDREIVQRSALALELELLQIDLALSPTSSEEAMRDARYQTLARTLNRRGITRVMTGHHAGDQAETLILQLVRGAGPEGASGMAEAETVTFDGSPPSEVELIRPLLGESRAELGILAAAYGLNVVADETNNLLDRSRNVVRHQVLPILSTLNDKAVANLARYTSIERDESAVLHELAEATLTTITRNLDLDHRLLGQFRIAIQRRVIRLWVERSTGLILTFDRTEAIRTLALEGQGESQLELGEGWIARRIGRAITLERASS